MLLYSQVLLRFFFKSQLKDFFNQLEPVGVVGCGCDCESGYLCDNRVSPLGLSSCGCDCVYLSLRVGFGLWSACIWASQVALLVKNLSANAADERDAGSVPGL